MKKQKLALLMAMCLLLPLSAGAVSGSVSQRDVRRYSVSIQGAAVGNNYVLILQKGALSAPSDSAEILYITQVKASAAEFTIADILPRTDKEISVFLIDESGIAYKLGQISSLAEGDVNKDGSVNETDLDVLLNYLACVQTLDEQQINAADIDRSGYLNVYDVSMLDEQYVK